MEKTPVLYSTSSTFPPWHGSQDVLHVFHQGVGCILVASLVCDSLQCKHVGITLKDMDARLSKEVYAHYKKWCRDRAPHATSCSHRFSATRFGKETWSSFPELGSIYKAAVVKCMIYWCAQYLKEERGVSGGEQRYRTMHQFALFQYLMDSNGPFFDCDTTGKVVQAARTGLLDYQRLASADRKKEGDRRTFKITPQVSLITRADFLYNVMQTQPQAPQLKGKQSFCCSKYFHQKTLIASSRLNNGSNSYPPASIMRFEHCYQDEDLMHQVSKIASRCHVNTMEVTTLSRYTGLLELFVHSSR